MLTNIRGLVNTLDLTPSHAMMPLYEAVSNALDAIDASGKDIARGKIDITLIRQDDLASRGGAELQLIDGFSVQDNGIGFNSLHFSAFKEAYTLMKVKLGGKGVGRFTYLKVFNEVAVKSVFQEKDANNVREFLFSIDQEVYDEKPIYISAEKENAGTTITIKGMIDDYREGWPKEASIVAEKIMNHFLIRFASDSCPTMWLHDASSPSINLQQLFRATIQPHSQDIPFKLREHQFGLQLFRQKGKRKHDLNLCALGREVEKKQLREVLPELPDRFLDVDNGGAPYTLKALVTGKYFVENINNQRTQIVFNPENDDIALGNQLIKRQELYDVISGELRRNLAGDLKTTNEEKIHGITKFAEKAPEYRVLLSEKYRTMLEQRIPPGCNDAKLDEHLLHMRREIEDGVRREGKEIAKLVDKVSFDEYKAKMHDLIQRINDVGKSQLASYVTHRRAILDLLDMSLKKSRTDEKYRLEEVLHNMVFPMGQTSRDVFLEQQNLWVIDERLSFHTILTSDKKLSSVSGLEKTSGKEPDVFAFFYDTPIGVREIQDGSGAVVVIEFKRPGRDDYKSDPAQQIIQRFVEIKNGDVHDIESRPINATNLRYFGYLIADLTPSLKKNVDMNYHPSIDGEGYFKTLAGGNGYVEIISYDKLFKDAKQRNRVLFDKLGLHKS